MISQEYVRTQSLVRGRVRLAVLTEQACYHPDVNFNNKQERIENASMKFSEWSEIQAQRVASFQASCVEGVSETAHMTCL